jgi:hypothetical protein
MGHYVLEENPVSEYRIFLGKFNIPEIERIAMIRGELRSIPLETMTINISYMFNEEPPDFLNLKFPLVSAKMKTLLDQTISTRIFYRKTLLLYGPKIFPYYYILTPKFDCLDEKNSHFEKDVKMPGGIRMTDGFYVHRDCVNGVDIFRMTGLSQKRIIISERLKSLFEGQGMIGIMYRATEQFCD